MKFRERFVSRVSPGLKNPAESFRPAVAHTLPVLFGASSTLLLTRLTFFFFTYLRCLCSRLSVEKLPVLH